MPLAMAKAGDRVTIRRITGQEELNRRLTNLGFVEDSNVTVVSELAGCLMDFWGACCSCFSAGAGKMEMSGANWAPSPPQRRSERQ